MITTWHRLKSIQGVKAELIQFVDKITYYDIWVNVNNEKVSCIIKKRNPRRKDQIDFEDNYKDNTNKSLTSVDSEGSKLSRTKITKTGWSFHMNGVQFVTSTLDSVYNKDDKGNDLGFATMTLYDDQDVEITNQATADTSCVKTVIDWEPSFDYEIIGGSIKMAQQTTEDVYMYCIGVPDIPAQLGGSKEFICCVNMKFIDSHASLKADGRTSKTLKYDPVYHTNKMRLIITHNPGIKCDLLLIFEIFKA